MACFNLDATDHLGDSSRSSVGLTFADLHAMRESLGCPA